MNDTNSATDDVVDELAKRRALVEKHAYDPKMSVWEEDTPANRWKWFLDHCSVLGDDDLAIIYAVADGIESLDNGEDNYARDAISWALNELTQLVAGLPVEESQQ